MRITIATWITILRLFLIVPILFLLVQEFYLLSLVLLLFALLTDYVDGQVARRTNTISKLGSFLDHLADKILVHLILLYFVSQHGLSWIAFGIFLARDFIVLGIRHLAAHRGVELSSMSLGKAKFAGQSILLVLLFLSLQFRYEWLDMLSFIVLWLVVILAVISAIQIVVAGKKVLY